jgi:hypothetical protein
MMGMDARSFARSGSTVVAEMLVNELWKQTWEICQGCIGDTWQ